MDLAFPNFSGPIFSSNSELWERGLQASRESKRKRMIYPIHRTQDAAVQRMFNFLQPGTYIRPHLHPRMGAVESLCLLSGAIHFLRFNANGDVVADHAVEAGGANAVLDIEPNIWHSFIVGTANTVLFETKMGPYDAELDKRFAPWSPEEFSEASEQWLAEMEERYLR